MGTRGAFGFRVNGQDKVAYNQFDSYPSGLGEDVVKFIRGSDMAAVREKAIALQPVSSDVPPTPEQIEQCKPWTDLGVSKQSTSDWYCLLRRTQGDPVAMLECGFYEDAAEFLKNRIFCEWAYIVDLDQNELIVFDSTEEVGRFKLDDIPKDWVSLVEKEEE